MGKGGWRRSIPPTPVVFFPGEGETQDRQDKKERKSPASTVIHPDRPIVRGLGIRTRPEGEKAKEG